MASVSRWRLNVSLHVARLRVLQKNSIVRYRMAPPLGRCRVSLLACAVSTRGGSRWSYKLKQMPLMSEVRNMMRRSGQTGNVIKFCYVMALRYVEKD